MEPRARRRWRFSHVELDGESLSLTVAGRAVEIEPKPLQVLVHLLEHAGKLVTKDALIQAVWPGRIIGDAALTKCIARLREAIGDRDQTLIKTHHRYGYRLIAEIEAPGAAVQTRAAPTVVVPATAVPEPVRPAQDTEHRPVTMLFCDVVGSTELAESLDPESFRALLLAYQQGAFELARRYEAHVAQQFGDGMLIYFGYPSAHDDDAERAIRYAFDLLRAQRADPKHALSLRIGIHSGPLMIGPGPAGEAQATGASLHLASRLQALAEPESILVSDATFRLVPGLFVTRDFGLHKFRGLGESIRVHQVLQASGVRSRLEAAPRLTAFAGREAEIALVTQSWQRAFEGEGQAVLICGEPGLGKSRLLMELRARLAGRAHTWLECRADALNRHSAFHAVAELLRRGLALRNTDDDPQQMQQLETRLDDLGLDPATIIPLLGPLLNLPATARYPASELAPELRRARTLDALADWVEHLAADQPMVVAFEDLHWADESSLEFLGSLMTRLAHLPVLLVMTTRPEFVSPWPTHAALHALTLDALAPQDVQRMLADLADGSRADAEASRLILARAGGVPLFVEELARALRESGLMQAKTEQPDAAIPASLNSLLRARLDRLGPARELIQAAAVIGAECSHRQLQQVAGLSEASLQDQLMRVIESGLLHARGTTTEAGYVFKHALIRDAAYAALTRSTRQTLHGRAADFIEAQHAARIEEHCAELAHHCEQAGQAERAARYAQQAGEHAIRRSANREAAVHLATAIRLSETLDLSPTRISTLISLYMSRVNLLTAINGYLHPDIDHAHNRAAELARLAERDAALVPVLYWIGALDTVRANHSSAIKTFAQLDALGEAIAMPVAGMVAGVIAGQSCFVLGRLDEAERWLRKSIASYHPAECRDIAMTYGEDSLSSGSGTLAWVVWQRGSPDQANALRERSLAHARELGNDYNLAIACTINCFGYHLAGETDAIVRVGQEAVARCRKGGYPWFQAYGEIALATHTVLHDPAGALIQIRAAVDVFTGGGANVFVPWAYGTLAEVQMRAGDWDGALRSVDTSFAFGDRTGEVFFRAEAFRLRGEIFLRSCVAGGMAAAEFEFVRAMEVAREQGERSWELRAATSLARLQRDTQRRDEARATLNPVYAWFTEGLDTPDLREAAALLAELGAR